MDWKRLGLGAERLNAEGLNIEDIDIDILILYPSPYHSRLMQRICTSLGPDPSSLSCYTIIVTRFPALQTDGQMCGNISLWSIATDISR